MFAKGNKLGIIHLAVAVLFVLVFALSSFAADVNDIGNDANLLPDLGAIPYRIIHEKFIKTGGKYNWELFVMNADGSCPVNITNTKNIDEMYPHASPDGSKVCFVAEAFEDGAKVRSVYYMNIDGSDRVKVAHNARQPCWGPDGKRIAYLKGEFERYTDRAYATGELIIYDVNDGSYRMHPSKELEHIYALCWSPDGEWFFAAIHGNRKYSDTILCFEADGEKIYDLEKWGVIGCRPEISRDGKKLTWGRTDWELCYGDIDFETGEPRVQNIVTLATCAKNRKVYYVDFSPDGKYISYIRGPFYGGQQVGGFAEGWDICVTDLAGNWKYITEDGQHNKEPDWVNVADTVKSVDPNAVKD